MELVAGQDLRALADAFATRLNEFEGTPLDRLTHAYHLAFSRAPTIASYECERYYKRRKKTKIQTSK
jgi:hypothetical protein